MVLQVTSFVMAAVIAAAHFLRQGSLWIAIACLLIPLLFLLRKRWSLIVLQLAAYAAATIWGFTAVELVSARMAIGLPWLRTAAILGAVALFTLAAGLVLNSRSARERYPA